MRAPLLGTLRLQRPKQWPRRPSYLLRSHTWDPMRSAQPDTQRRHERWLRAAMRHHHARWEAQRLIIGMSDDVVRALSSPPALGEDRSGPLGPGRISLGHVDEAIRDPSASDAALWGFAGSAIHLRSDGVQRRFGGAAAASDRCGAAGYRERATRPARVRAGLRWREGLGGLGSDVGVASNGQLADWGAAEQERKQLGRASGQRRSAPGQAGQLGSRFE